MSVPDVKKLGHRARAKRRRFRAKLLRDLDALFNRQRDDKLAALLGVTDEEWLKAETVIVVPVAEAKRDPQSITEQMTTVQRFVYIIVQGTDMDEAVLAAELTMKRIRAYEDELTIQAAAVGCTGRAGRLTNDMIQRDIRDKSREDAISILNTYDYDIAREIRAIAKRRIRANRYIYAYHLRAYMKRRQVWKRKQIAEYTDNWARSKAQHDFVAVNRAMGMATLEPRTAVCPVCKGVILRGKIPLQRAMAFSPPYHVNCPHVFDITYDGPYDCAKLWMGE